MLILKREEILPVLVDLYRVTGIKFSVGTESNGVVVQTGDFCEKMQSNLSFHEACVQCDKKAIKRCYDTKKGFIYRCHAGFLEYASPIFCEGRIIAVATSGAIIEGTDDELELIKSNMFAYGLTNEEIERIYGTIVRKDIQTMRACCNLLEACISHFVYKKMLGIRVHKTVLEIDNYIMNNISEKIDVTTLCKEFGVSKAELYRIFRSEFTTTVTDYIQKKRIKLACDLLQDKNATVAEVAAQVGYPDYSYFSKVFHKECGVSPREYRQSILSSVLKETEFL